ncbi:MAG: T9SS type A sorting domain-containing protein [Bacteroidota bacterium]
MYRSATALFALLAALLAASPFAQAQSCTTSWSDPIDGTWADATRWSDGVPGAADTACITVGGSYTVSATGSPISVAGLALGDGAGAPNLVVGVDMVVTNNAEVATGARVETTGERTASLRVAGILALAGTLVQRDDSRLMDAFSGTLDVAPGGTLRLVGADVRAGTPGVTRFVIRGTIEADACGTDTEGRCILGGSFDLRGGTLRAAGGSFWLQSVSTDNVLAGVTLDAAEGATLQVRSGTFDAQGTVSGAPAGNVVWSATANVGAAGLTLDVGGTGLQVGTDNLSRGTFAGGAVTNIATVRTEGGGMGLDGATFENTALLDVNEGVSLDEGAVLVNAETGTVLLASGEGIRQRGTGDRFVSRGLVEVEPGTSQAQTNVPFEVDGGTLRIQATGFATQNGILLRDATLEASAGSDVSFSETTIAGTLSGASGGDVILGGTLTVADEGAVIAVGGRGLDFGFGALQLDVEGGTLTNRGFATLRTPRLTTTFVNEGDLDVLAVRLTTSGELRNAPEGTLALRGIASGADNETGLVVNEGLIRVDGVGTRAFQGQLRAQPGSEIRVASEATLTLGSTPPAFYGAGTVLAGTGAVSRSGGPLEGTVSPGGPGPSLGVLDIPTFALSSLTGDARYVVDVRPGGGSDRIATGFSVTLGGTLVVRVPETYAPIVGETWTIVQSDLNPVAGAFDAIEVEGAPEGTVFAVDVEGTRAVLRVADAVVGGGIALSEVAPMGGSERALFLAGSGAADVTAVRLVCDSCLDPDAFGTLPGTLSDDGPSLAATFDLTDPRVIGGYDLVLERGALPDTTLALTVRPYLAFPTLSGGFVTGLLLAPSNTQFHRNAMNVVAPSNGTEPAFVFAQVLRPRPDVIGMKLGSYRPYGRTFEFYNADEAADPTRAPLVVGRLSPASTAVLDFPLRIDPMAVLFPNEEPAGPEDNRIPFGSQQAIQFSAYPHFAPARFRGVVERALRGSAPLAAYLASVDDADAEAVTAAVRTALDADERYLTGPADLLGGIVDALSATVEAPDGTVEGAQDAFQAALVTEADLLSFAITEAHEQARSGALAGLFDAEIAVLFPEAALQTPAAAARAQNDGDGGVLRCIGFGDSIDAINSRSDANGFLDRMEARQGSGPGSGGSPSGGGCARPRGAVDPNDKIANTTLPCEFGTVLVDGEEVFRCVRYYVPLAQAAEPIAYTILFENLPEATDPAQFVTITDVLDPSFDPATLDVTASSFDEGLTTTVAGQTVTFRFDGIELAPNVNPPEGEGFVSFTVAPRTALAAGTVLSNEADIVFDFNPPIETPAVLHEVREVADLLAVVDLPDDAMAGDVTFDVLPAHAGGDDARSTVLTFTAPVSIAAAATEDGDCDGLGTTMVTCALGTLADGDEVPVTVTLAGVPEGTYTLRAAVASDAFDGFAANDEDLVQLTVLPVGIEDESGLPRTVRLAEIYPNPTRTTATLRWGLPTAADVDLRVYDLLGRLVAVLADDAPTEAGWHETPWSAQVASGVYIARLDADGVTRTKKLVVVR